MLTGLVEKGRNKCELYFPLGKKTDTKEKTFFYVKTPKVRDKFTFDSCANTNTYDIETYEFEEKNEVTFDKYQVTYVGQRDLDECQIRQLELRKTDLNAEPRTIYHYWLSNWPDHKKTNAEQVLKMAVDVLRCLDSTKGDISGKNSIDFYCRFLQNPGFVLQNLLVPVQSQKYNDLISKTLKAPQAEKKTAEASLAST